MIQRRRGACLEPGGRSPSRRAAPAGRPTRTGALCLALAASAAPSLGSPAVALAQQPEKAEHAGTATAAEGAVPFAATDAGLPTLDASCHGADEFGGALAERAAFCLLQGSAGGGERPFVSVRALADRALREDSSSFRAHYLLGVVQHQGEGNLPKALYHLERAEALFIGAHGERPSITSSPWSVFHRTLLELVYVHGEMDHHEEKILYVDHLKERLGLGYEALKAWPLLKLKRFEEARVYALAAANSEESWTRAVGLTALCAVESEQRRRQEAYEACRAAAQPILETSEGAIELSNAAAAASEVFRFDEAERYYLQAAEREIEGSVNPWGRLVRLYLRQGRFAEAVSALREMHQYRLARPKYLDQQDQSDADLIGASLLMIAGRLVEAEKVTSRTVHRPDRQGTSSAQSEQNEGGAAIMDRAAKLALARHLEEEASASELGDALSLRARALRLRFEAWVSGRRAAEALADEERLVSSLRPECPGSIELPEWLDAEVISVVGSGVALAAIARAREAETLPGDHAEPIFRALEAEALLAQGDAEEALEKAQWVVDAFAPIEALLRARSAAIGGAAAAEAGDLERAVQLYAMAMRTDPGVIRRLGLRLPVVIEAGGGSEELTTAARLLEGSPILEVVPWGFELIIAEGAATLSGADGTVIATVAIPPGKPSDREGLARRIAKTVQRDLFVPNVDITQADIRSLDGSLGSGGRASERAKSVLDEVLGEPGRGR